MKFENSEYAKRFNYIKEVFDFGNLYITKQFAISEINEGVHVDHNIASEIIGRFIEHINHGNKVGYISNRCNSYSLNPQLWVEINSEYDFLIATAVVSYNDHSYLTASLEKEFFQKSLKRCRTLNEAIEWIRNLDEFK